MTRIALFTHDAFGLGHMRRSIHIINAISKLAPDASVLLITGSSSVQMLQSLPSNADYLKIPTISTSGNRDDSPPMLNLSVIELATLRGHITREALIAFGADVFLVDNFPLGTRFELLPALKSCRQFRIPAVLGMRDVLDPPKKVCRSWTRDGMYAVIERYFSRILVYGERDIFDVVKGYELSQNIADRVRYCGYVAASKPGRDRIEEIRGQWCKGRKLIVACVGGGGDGLPLLRCFLDAMKEVKDTDALIVTGELMSDHDRTEIARELGENEHILLKRYVPDLADHMAAADLVIAMAGYNTSAEILSMQVPAIVVPRTWRSGEHATRDAKSVDGEQLFRARLLSKKALLRFIHPDDLTAAALANEIVAELSRTGTRLLEAVNVEGATRVAEELLDVAMKSNGT